MLYSLGMPRVKLNVAQAAAAAGGIKPSTWRAYVARGRAPKPDGFADPCGCPWWWESTVVGWQQSRPRAA